MEFKGLLHAHSTFSKDGKYNIQQIKEFYKDYDFITITNHYEHCFSKFNEILAEIKAENKKLNSIGKKQLIIFGFEYQYNCSHIIFLGMNEEMPDDLEQIKQVIRQKNPVVILAHPQLKDLQFMEKSLLDFADGFELYNSLHNDRHFPAFHLFKKLRKLQQKNPKLKAFFGEDFHNGINSDTAIYVTADKLEEKEILMALKQGNFYVKNKYFTYYSNGKLVYDGRIIFPYVKSYAVGLLQYASPKFGKVISYLPYNSKIKEKLHRCLKLLFGKI